MRIYFCKGLYSISYIGTEMNEHSTCCRGGQLMDFCSLSGSDAILFASCYGDCFERFHKLHCKQI